MKKRISEKKHFIFVVALVCLIVVGCAGMTPQFERKKVPEVAPGYLMPYLARADHPNSLTLLAPPPANGSPAFAADQAAAQEGYALRETLRWTLAREDADLAFPRVAGTFSCAIGAPITEKDTPILYTLLQRTKTDAGISTMAAKKYYNRTRPFVFNKKTSCTPEDEKELSTNGSYPSGHSSMGWTWALILTELAPDKMNAILSRGRAFAESRVICGVHWLSDINAGMVTASGTVARLQADPEFRKDLEAARAELNDVRAKGLPPNRDCDVEKAALSIKLFR